MDATSQMGPVATFRRSAESGWVGFVSYCVLGPVAGLLVGGLISGLVFGCLRAADVPEGIATSIALHGLPVTFVGLILFAVRDYRRRASVSASIFPDRVSVSTERIRRDVLFDDTQTVRLVQRRGQISCVLRLTNGENFTIPQHLAPFDKLRRPLEATLVPKLVRQVNEDFLQGTLIWLRSSTTKAVLKILIGFVFLILGLLLLGTVVLMPRQQETFTVGIPFGAGFVIFGTRHVWIGVRDRQGGILIKTEGVMNGRGQTMTWQEIQSIQCDQLGIVVRSSSGATASASFLAENAWPVALWLRENVVRLCDSSNRQFEPPSTATAQLPDWRWER